MLPFDVSPPIIFGAMMKMTLSTTPSLNADALTSGPPSIRRLTISISPSLFIRAPKSTLSSLLSNTRTFVPNSSNSFTLSIGACSVVAMMVGTDGLEERTLAISGIFNLLSTTILTGFFTLPVFGRAVRRGSSERIVPIPTIIASTVLLNLCT